MRSTRSAAPAGDASQCAVEIGGSGGTGPDSAAARALAKSPRVTPMTIHRLHSREASTVMFHAGFGPRVRRDGRPREARALVERELA